MRVSCSYIGTRSGCRHVFKRGLARPAWGRGERLDDIANGQGLRESRNNLAMVARTLEHLVEAMFLRSWCA
jgi:hypothetical protein